MKIALLTDKFATGGGLEHIFQLCQGMPDIEFGIFAANGEARSRFDSLPNVSTFTANDARAVRAFAPDLLHYHHLRPLLQRSMPRTRSIFTVHGIHLHKFEFQRGLRAAISRAARLTLEKLLYRKIDDFITVSDEDAIFLRQHYGVVSTTIYNGIDLAPVRAIRESKAVLRERLGLPQDKRLYLTVARFDFPKGHDVLVRAIAELHRAGNIGNRLFVFAGDGALLSQTRALAADLGVSAHIVFLGRRRDAYELMAASDVFILPSRWEGLPITLIEAQAARLPAIASRTYGIATIKRETGDNIHLFENENHCDLARAIAGEVFFTECRLDQFSLGRMVEQTAKVYRGS